MIHSAAAVAADGVFASPLLHDEKSIRRHRALRLSEFGLKIGHFAEIFFESTAVPRPGDPPKIVRGTQPYILAKMPPRVMHT